MDEEIVLKRLGGISDEIESVSKSISEGVSVISEKKYFDETIGDKIKEAITEVLVKLSVSDAGKNYYHNELVDLLKNAFIEVISKIVTPVVDMSPVLKIAENINVQNKKILESFVSVIKLPKDDSKYDDILLIMQHTNELLKTMISMQKSISDSKQVKEIKEIESYQFVHVRDNDRIKSTTVIPKYKS